MTGIYGSLSPVSSSGTVANEMGAVFSAMLTGRRSPLSLMALKSKVGELCHQFSGCEQQDSQSSLCISLLGCMRNSRDEGCQLLRAVVIPFDI